MVFKAVPPVVLGDVVGPLYYVSGPEWPAVAQAYLEPRPLKVESG